MDSRKNKDISRLPSILITYKGADFVRRCLDSFGHSVLDAQRIRVHLRHTSRHRWRPSDDFSLMIVEQQEYLAGSGAGHDFARFVRQRRSSIESIRAWFGELGCPLTDVILSDLCQQAIFALSLDAMDDKSMQARTPFATLHNAFDQVPD